MANMETSRAEGVEEVHSTTSDSAKEQYHKKHEILDSLRLGREETFDNRTWERGQDGRLYYNTHKLEQKDKTYGCISDPEFYVRNGEGEFDKVKGVKVNGNTFLQGESGNFYDIQGERVSALDVFAMREALETQPSGPESSEEQEPARPSLSDFLENRSDSERVDSDPERVDGLQEPVNIRAEYEDIKNKEQLDKLRPGESAMIGEHAWIRGKDGALYCNPEGFGDLTFLGLADNECYIKKGQEFIKVEEHRNREAADSARFYVDSKDNVYNCTGGGPLKRNANGVYRLPNSETRIWEYTSQDRAGNFYACDEYGRRLITPSAPSPDVSRDRAERIVPQRDMLERAERQSTVARNTLMGVDGERLVDTSGFMDSVVDERLARFGNQRDAMTGIAFSRSFDNGYSFSRDGETWQISQSPFYRDQYPNGQSFTKSKLVIRKAGTDGQVQREFRSVEVFDPDTGAIDFAKVDKLMNEAESNRLSERRDGANSQDITLGHERVGYIGLVCPNKSDPVINGLRQDVIAFPHMMNSIMENGVPKYNFESINGSESIEVRSNPKELLRETLHAMRDSGIRTFYLNMAGHGNSQGIHFTEGGMFSGHEILSGQDLNEIYREFPDCRFVVDTVACLGGGLAEAMEDYQDVQGAAPGRIAVKLQAKPDSVNQEGRLVAEPPNIPEPFSSYYNLFNTYYLRQGYSVGEAHLRADRDAKRYSPCDAEIWVSSPNGSTATKGI